MRTIIGFIAASVIAAAVGSLVQTQANIAALAALNVAVPVGARVNMAVSDLIHFAPLYAGVVGAALLLGFLVAGWLGRRLPALRTLLFAAAGGAAIATAIVVMNSIMPLTPIAATRSALAIVVMTAGGVLGGWCFARMTALRRAPRSRAA